MTYLCPKCKSLMVCVSTASIPAYYHYSCLGCGYTSKVMQEQADCITLPPWLQSEESEEEE